MLWFKQLKHKRDQYAMADPASNLGELTPEQIGSARDHLKRMLASPLCQQQPGSGISFD
jgi:hypothetical protein